MRLAQAKKMYQAPLPPEYQDLTPEETRERIKLAKAALGSRIVILGHHYQRDEIIEHADYRGDSYKLCKDAQRHPEAEFIVFCGVHFMAESADILTDKRVILPNLAAGCSMADMAGIFQVRRAWKELEEVFGGMEGWKGGRLEALAGTSSNPKPKIQNPKLGGLRPSTFDLPLLPITYINSAASLKAFVGERGGTVCTSTNAPVAVKWALDRAERVLFFPDQHLGRNTSIKLGYDADEDMALWDPFKPLGGNTPEKLKESKFILWKGHCSVHTRFTPEQVLKARKDFPGCKVIVHPECPNEVVELADCAGSTEFIIKTVSAGEPGSVWAVGTEINLVSRLAKDLPDRQVFCLDSQICPCSTMYRIHPSFLLWALENLVRGNVVNEIQVPEETKKWSRVALERMLELI
jgi:quinolinate synthase